MTDTLSEDLRALAARARQVPLDLVAVRRAVQRRRRRRRAAVLAPLAVLLAALLVAVPHLRGEPTEALTSPGTMAPLRLQVSVSDAVLAPEVAYSGRSHPAPVLTVSSDAEPRPVTSEGAALALTWTSGPSTVVRPEIQGGLEFRARSGGGVLGIVGTGCSGGWDAAGQRYEPSCAATPTTLLAPGESDTVLVTLSPVVTSGRVAPGTYDVALPAPPYGVVDLTLTVTSTRATAPASTALGRSELLRVADAQAGFVKGVARRVVAVRTDREGVTRLTGDDPGPYPGNDVWFVQVSGDGYRCGPSCFSVTSVPTGPYLQLVVDAGTLVLQSFGLAQEPVTLSLAGDPLVLRG